MDWFLVGLIVSVIIAAILLIPIPKRFRRDKKINIKKRYPISGAMLSGVTEVFQPSAANASAVVEEQREARKALPSPEDKDFPEEKKNPQSKD
jgi:hypothetical protein